MNVTVPATSRFLICLPFSLNVEAGYQCLAGDDGNWTGGSAGVGSLVGTNRGITPIDVANFRGIKPSAVTVAIMQALTQDEATAIYAVLYWNPIQGDSLLPGVDLATFDMTINAGSAGAKCLQRAIGLTGTDVDGWIGTETLLALGKVNPAAVARTLSKTAAVAVQETLGFTGDDVDGDVGPKTLSALTALKAASAIALCGAMYDQRIASYKQDSGWGEFGVGWTNRDIACLSASLAMAV